METRLANRGGEHRFSTRPFHLLPTTMTLLISFSQTLEIMQQSGGLRYREARRLLEQQQPPPVAHAMHSRRRWMRQAVLDFCADLQKRGPALGEGCVGCGSHATVNPAAPDVLSR